MGYTIPNTHSIVRIIIELVSARQTFKHLINNYSIFNFIDKNYNPDLEKLYNGLVENVCSSILDPMLQGRRSVKDLSLNYQGSVDNFIYSSSELLGKIITYETAYKIVNQVENSVIEDIFNMVPIPDIDSINVILLDYKFINKNVVLVNLSVLKK